MESGDSLLLSPPDSKSLSQSSPKPQPQSLDVQAAVTIPMVPTHSPPPPVSSPAPAPSGQDGPEDGPHSDDDIPSFFEHVPIINQTRSREGHGTRSSPTNTQPKSQQSSIGFRDQTSSGSGHSPSHLETKEAPDTKRYEGELVPGHEADNLEGRGRGRGRGRGGGGRGHKGKHEQMSAASPGPASPAAVSTVSAGARKRSVRCKVCGPCRAEDCGTCDNCLDKPKFGGPNKKKQTCINRKCVNMLHKTRPDTTAVALTTTEDLSQMPMDDIPVDIVGQAAVDTREEHSASSSAPALLEDGPQTPGIISFGSHGFFIPSSTGAEDGVMPVSDESMSQLSAEALFQEKFKRNLTEENIPFKENMDGLLDIQLKDDGPGHVIKRPQEFGSTTPVPDTSSPPLIPPNVPLPPEHMVVKTSYHGVLSADQAKARLRDQRLDNAFICRESDVRSGEYVISYYAAGEVKHILLPIENESKKGVVEVFSDLIRSKDYLQYPVSPVGGYEWSDAHFQRPRGRGQGRRGAVRGRRGATRGRPGASRGRRGAARGQRPGRSQSGGSRHGEQSKAGCCGQGHGQDDCGDVGDTGGSCHDHEHDNAHDDHNDGSPKELCFVCSETIDKKFLAKHLKVHRQSWCGECLKYINYNTFWSRHRPQCTAYHSADLLTCEVSYCNYSTKWRDHMKNHQKFHITKPFNCKSCSRCFETAEQLEIHTINKHSNPRHRCHYCDRGFRDSYDCNRHMRSQHLFPTIRNAAGVFRMDTGGGVRRKKGRTLHNCSECNFKTTVRKRLHRHTRAKHCPKTPTIYLCQGEGCNFKHHFKSRYARHIKTCKRFKVRCQK